MHCFLVTEDIDEVVCLKTFRLSSAAFRVGLFPLVGRESLGMSGNFGQAHDSNLVNPYDEQCMKWSHYTFLPPITRRIIVHSYSSWIE